MNPRLLIDGIVQQTTVLIARLSTVAGVRSPLAHVADRVFLSLSEEIERQGVGRKVVADMFGLALRSYQRKVQRLTESASDSARTLWEAVLEFLGDQGPVRRDRLLERFRHDDEPMVLAALNDLVQSGLVYSAGRAEGTVYGVTSEAARRELAGDDVEEAIAILVWGMVFRNPGITVRELLEQGRLGPEQIRAALSRLLLDGRVSAENGGDDARLTAAPYVIPVGARQGWEAAVLDHFIAIANAIAMKAQGLAAGEAQDARVGGSTLHFGVYPGHPYENEVFASLARLRTELNALWNTVADYNRAHPVPDEAATRVTVYVGQYVQEPADPELAASFEPEKSGESA